MGIGVDVPPPGTAGVPTGTGQKKDEREPHREVARGARQPDRERVAARRDAADVTTPFRRRTP